MFASKPKPCDCGANWHTAWQCPSRKKPMKRSTKPLQAKKPMNKVGKIGKALAKQSREWREENPPNHEGYYICYLCGRWILAELMNLEHPDSKARHPEFRFVKGKLRPACGECNEDKGSLGEQEYLEKMDKKHGEREAGFDSWI